MARQPEFMINNASLDDSGSYCCVITSGTSGTNKRSDAAIVSVLHHAAPGDLHESALANRLASPGRRRVHGCAAHNLWQVTRRLQG